MGLSRVTSLVAGLAAGCLLAVALAGCGGGGGGGSIATLGPVKSNVVVLPAGAVLSRSAGSVTLHGTLPKIVVGDVIVSGDGQGLLAHVIAISSSSGNPAITTTQATLADVFNSADIELHRDLGAADFAAAKQTFDRAAVMRRRGPGVNPITVAINNPLYTNGSQSVSLTGSATLLVRLDESVIIDSSGVKSAVSSPLLTGTVNASVNSQALAPALTLQKVPIETLTGNPITVTVSGVPIVFTPVINLFAQLDGSLQPGLTFTTGGTAAAGAQASFTRDSGWQNKNSVSQTPTLTPTGNPYAAASVDITPLRSELGVLLFSVNSGYLNVNLPQYKLTLTRLKGGTPPVPGTGLADSATIAGDTGYNSAALDPNVPSASFPGVINTSVNIANGFKADGGAVHVGID